MEHEKSHDLEVVGAARECPKHKGLQPLESNAWWFEVELM